jgi:serine/threonine-protein kinase
MPIDSVVSLLDALRQTRLLPPAQWEEVLRLQGQLPDPRALARELVRRGWLTPYQVNQLFQGRGEELLLGSYVLLEKLGQGGMGAVFKARNWKLGKVVALKVIRAERLGSDQALRRFGREIRAAARRDHPHIVHAHDADEVGNTLLLVMEYVEGGTDLARLLKDRGPLPVRQACEFARQAALGLQHAHEKGLVHRDVKPSNLLLGADGVVKVLDLGLAHLEQTGEDDSASALTEEGTVMGTFDYIAPEQATDARAVDTRADLYSLGCTLYHLLTGRVPFPGGKPLDKLYRHSFEEPAALEGLRPDVPAAVAAVVRRLMAKRPQDRYQTPAEAAAALADALGAVPPAETPPAPTRVADSTAETDPFANLVSSLADAPGPLSASARPAAWRRLLLPGGAVVLLLGAVLGAWLAWGLPRPGGGAQAATVVEVQAGLPWQDTGVEVRAGEAVTLTARGSWQKKGLEACSADGLPGAAGDRAVLPEGPPCCLIGRVGDAEVPFFVGAGQVHTPRQGGRLFVQANDLDLGEMTGSLRLEVQGGRRGERAAPPPALLPVQATEAELRSLLARAADPRADREQLRADLVGFLPRNGGTPQGLRAAGLLRGLPSPLDELDAARVPARQWAAAGTGDPGPAPAELVALLDDESGEKPEYGLSTAFDPDGRRLAVGVGRNFKSTVDVWDVVAGRVVLTLDAARRVRGVAFTPDGRRVASCGLTQATVCDAVTGQEVLKLSPPADTAPQWDAYGLSITPDGRRLVMGGGRKGSGWVAVWETATGRRVLDIHDHANAVTGVAFSPDGRHLASASQDKTVKVWDAETGRQVVTCAGSFGAAGCVAFSPDGRRLAAGCSDQTVRVWDAATGQEVLRLPGHDSPVRGVVFSPDGQALASAGRAGRLLVSEPDGGKPLRAWQLPGELGSVTFAPDSRHLAAANGNGTVFILRLGPPTPAGRP